MIRITKSSAIQILMGMLYNKAAGRTQAGVRDYCQNTYFRSIGNASEEDLGPVLRELFSKYFRLDEGEEKNLKFDSIIEQLVKQINEDGQNSDGTLIDQLVEVLQKPYRKNILSGQSLQQLEQALLIPSELAGLTSRLAKREMSCTHCGHIFVNGEMLTAQVRENLNGEPIGMEMVCQNCCAPSYVKCSQCNSQAEITKRQHAAINKDRLCNKCKESKKSGNAVAASDTPEPTVLQPERDRVEPFRSGTNVVMEARGQPEANTRRAEVRSPFRTWTPRATRMAFSPDMLRRVDEVVRPTDPMVANPFNGGEEGPDNAPF